MITIILSAFKSEYSCLQHIRHNMLCKALSGAGYNFEDGMGADGSGPPEQIVLVTVQEFSPRVSNFMRAMALAFEQDYIVTINASREVMKLTPGRGQDFSSQYLGTWHSLDDQDCPDYVVDEAWHSRSYTEINRTGKVFGILPADMSKVKEAKSPKYGSPEWFNQVQTARRNQPYC